MLAVLSMLAIVLQAADPVPPQRVDPKSVPMPASNDPVGPTTGQREQQASGQQRPQEQRTGQQRIGQQRTEQGRASSRLHAGQAGPMRMAQAPSIFTDEAYRRARVRSLLQYALDEGGW